MNVRLSSRAQRDFGRLDAVTRRRVMAAFRSLAADAPNLDIKALAGAAPWLRLRVGAHRVLLRRLNADWYVESIVDRRDLDRAVRSLPD